MKIGMIFGAYLFTAIASVRSGKYIEFGCVAIATALCALSFQAKGVTQIRGRRDLNAFSPKVIAWKLQSYAVLGPAVFFTCVAAMRGLIPKRDIYGGVPENTMLLWAFGFIVSIVLYFIHVFSEKLARSPGGKVFVAIVMPIIACGAALLYWKSDAYISALVLSPLFVFVVSGAAHDWSGSILDGPVPAVRPTGRSWSAR